MIYRFKHKILLLVPCTEMSHSCGANQMCGGLEADVKGRIYFMRSLWKMHSDEDEWGVLLIYVDNAFNEGNRRMMVCIALHE